MLDASDACVLQRKNAGRDKGTQADQQRQMMNGRRLKRQAANDHHEEEPDGEGDGC